MFGHFELPEMGHFESGLPHFSKSASLLDKAPRDYKSVFRDGRSPDKIPEWAPFYDLARMNDRLKRYFDETPKYRMELDGAAELFQLARSRERRFLLSTNECVVGVATHAIVFHGWCIKNDSHWIRSNTLSSAENFRDVIERLDHFLAALRAVSDVQTGYCQLLIRPDGWCDEGTAYLPQVEVIPMRAYPDHFEHYGWLHTPPVLDAESCSEAGKLCTALTTLSKNQLLVASRRLNLAMLRSSEQDSIMDVAIGLETLLVEDGAKGEINHKLAMRLAALCKMRPFEDYRPAEVFGLCKKLYGFRSAVAHGSQDMSKKRVI